MNKEGNTKNKVILNRTLDSITIEEIVMNNDNREQIRLKGQLADSTYKDLELQFKIVSLNKIAPAIDSLNLTGEINGILNLRQEDGVYLPICNLDIQDFGVNGVDLGQLKIGMVGNKDLTEFVVNNIEKLGLFGKVTNKNNEPKADVVASFSNFDLAPFSPLGEGVITNIRGNLNGSAQIRGDIENPDISGLLTLDNAEHECRFRWYHKTQLL